MSKGLGLGGILDSIINKERQTKKELENLKLSQLANDLQKQENFLQDQDTKMGVSKDAMSKYPTFRGIPTQLIGVFTIVGGILLFEKGVNIYILEPIDKGPQQEEVVNDTQENLQNTFVLDSTTIIDYYKENLSADEIEEFEQFSKEEQRRQAQDNNK